MEYEQGKRATAIDSRDKHSKKDAGATIRRSSGPRLSRHPQHDIPGWAMPLLVQLERWTRRSKTRIQAVRSLRNFLYFGFLQRFYSQRRPTIHAAKFNLKSTVLVSARGLGSIVPTLKVKGFDVSCRLRPELVAQLQGLLLSFEDGIHVDMDKRHVVIHEIVHDPGVLQVVHSFLDCDPVLLECKLSIGPVYDGDTLSAGFHFDHTGAPSLNLMVYITDIDEHTAPHVVIEGTQHDKRLRDFLRETLPMAEALERFPDRIRTITGPAGTVIFENTEAFHTRVAGHKRRAILNVLYSVRGKRLLSQVTAYRRNASHRVLLPRPSRGREE